MTEKAAALLILSLALAAAVVIVLSLIDDTIKTEDDLTSNFNLPILAAIPDHTIKSKGGGYYGYSKTSKNSSSKNRKKPDDLNGED